MAYVVAKLERLEEMYRKNSHKADSIYADCSTSMHGVVPFELFEPEP